MTTSTPVQQLTRMLCLGVPLPGVIQPSKYPAYQIPQVAVDCATKFTGNCVKTTSAAADVGKLSPPQSITQLETTQPCINCLGLGPTLSALELAVEHITEVVKLAIGTTPSTGALLEIFHGLTPLMRSFPRACRLLAFTNQPATFTDLQKVANQTNSAPFTTWVDKQAQHWEAVLNIKEHLNHYPANQRHEAFYYATAIEHNATDETFEPLDAEFVREFCARTLGTTANLQDDIQAFKTQLRLRARAGAPPLLAPAQVLPAFNTDNFTHVVTQTFIHPKTPLVEAFLHQLGFHYCDTLEATFTLPQPPEDQRLSHVLTDTQPSLVLGMSALEFLEHHTHTPNGVQAVGPKLDTVTTPTQITTQPLPTHVNADALLQALHAIEPNPAMWAETTCQAALTTLVPAAA